jgi:alpha-D-xyloside xylohydrolase
MLESREGSLYFRHGFEILRVEPWGPHAFRIRATRQPSLPSENWALSQPLPPPSALARITLPSVQTTLPADDFFDTPVAIPKPASIVNGNITAEVTARGKLTITNTTTGKPLLEEYSRNRLDITDPKLSSLSIKARDFKPSSNGSNHSHLTYRLESLSSDEKIYGMGQYQQPLLDLKGLDLELAQRNSQASVPFLVSNLGYGLLWNNPAIGRAVFGKNLMTFEAYSTTVLDYWIVAGESPAEILEAYGLVAGTVPMMPEYGLGFWQCKLRYQTQEELLDVAREYRRRELPIDVIVIDFFHWPIQGSWMFDKQFWPDPGENELNLIFEYYRYYI